MNTPADLKALLADVLEFYDETDTPLSDIRADTHDAIQTAFLGYCNEHGRYDLLADYAKMGLEAQAEAAADIADVQIDPCEAPNCECTPETGCYYEAEADILEEIETESRAQSQDSQTPIQTEAQTPGQIILGEKFSAGLGPKESSMASDETIAKLRNAMQSFYAETGLTSITLNLVS